MKQYLFRKDFWITDFLSSIIFALCLSTQWTKLGESFPVPSSRMFFFVYLAVCSYVVTFIIALLLRSKIPSFRSWFWLGVVGPFLMTLADMFPLSSRTHTFHHEHSGIPALIYSLTIDLVSFVVIWMVWAVLGLTVIFGVRLILYFCKKITGGERIPL